jgi:gas vesicle protein
VAKFLTITEESSMSDEYGDSGGSASDVILAFLLGGIAGAGLALLYAPRSGRETREMLGERLRDTAERGRELRDEAITRGRTAVDEAQGYVERKKQAIEDRKDRLQAAVEAGRQVYREERTKPTPGA